MNTNSLYRREMMIMRTAEGFYPIKSSGKKHVKLEAADHGEINNHILSIEDMEGNVLWKRQ